MVLYTSKLLKGAGIIFITGALTSILGYSIRLLLAQKLTPEEFGLFFAVYNIVLIIGWVKGFGQSSSIQKYTPELKLKRDFQKIKSVLVFVFSFTLLSSVLIFLIFYTLPALFVNSYFQSSFGKSLLLILLLYIFIDGFSQVISSYLLAVHSFFLYSLKDIIIRSTILVLLLMLGANIIGVGWIYVAGAIIALFLNCLFLLRSFPFFSYPMTIDKELFKKVFLFGTPLIIRDFFGTIMSYTDNLMLVYFRPLAEVAMYNVILPTADLLLVVGRPFARIIFPFSSELWALGETSKLKFLIKKIHKYLLVILIPFSVFMFVFAQDIISILFGEKYGQGYLGLRFLLFAFLFPCFSLINYNVLLGIGKSKEATKATIITNLINVGLNFMLIPMFGKSQRGYFGAILSTLFSSMFLFLFLLYYLYLSLEYVLPWKEMVLTIMVGLFFLPLGLFIHKFIYNHYLSLIIFFVLICFLYPLLLFLFGVISRKEITGLVIIIKSGFKGEDPLSPRD